MAQELFDDLYRLLRGSQAATALVEAKSLHAEEKFGECVNLLERTLERYAQSRESTLSKDLSHVEAIQPGKLDKETKRLVRKQGKATDALEQFQELIEKVRRSVRQANAKHKPASDTTLLLTTAKPQSTVGETTQPPALDPMNALREQFSKGKTFAQKQEAIESYCDVQPLHSASEIQEGDLLLAISDGKQYLISVDSPAIDEEQLRICSAMDGSPMKPLLLEKVHLSISRSKLHLLIFKSRSSSRRNTTAGEELDQAIVDLQTQNPSEYSSKLSIQQRDQILDAGAFSQLIDAAQRSGIVPGIAMIIQVRDCEFRLGKYHQALQLIESLLSAFVGSATQRTQRLKREEQDIASGRVKMSPKDMQAKRARDNKESELIERTKTRFTRVLEGIRAIIHLENELGGISR